MHNKTEDKSVQIEKALSLIWTNVARANVKETVEICLDVPRNLILKLGQDWVSYSLDIAA